MLIVWILNKHILFKRVGQICSARLSRLCCKLKDIKETLNNCHMSFRTKWGIFGNQYYRFFAMLEMTVIQSFLSLWINCSSSVALWFNPLAGRWKTICVAAAVLKTDSKCSFIMHKLRFFACFCLASAASKTFFNGLLELLAGWDSNINKPAIFANIDLTDGTVMGANRRLWTSRQFNWKHITAYCQTGEHRIQNYRPGYSMLAWLVPRLNWEWYKGLFCYVFVRFCCCRDSYFLVLS